MEEGRESPAKISAVQSVLYSLDSKLPGEFNGLVNQLVSVLEEGEVEEKVMMRREYIQRERSRFNRI